MWQLPNGYTVYAVKNDGNTVLAKKETSTPAKPRFIQVDRKDPVWNAQAAAYSVPEYRVRVSVGTVDAVSGAPLEPKLMADLTFRTPVTATSDISEWFEDVLAVVNADDFELDGIVAHQLPSCCEDNEDTPEE